MFPNLQCYTRYLSLWIFCFTLHLGKQEEAKVDDVFSGFKKNNLFKSMKLGLMQAIFLFMEPIIYCSRYY